MAGPFIGSEAVAAGRLRKYDLLTRFIRVYPDVYIVTSLDTEAVIIARLTTEWNRRTCNQIEKSA